MQSQLPRPCHWHAPARGHSLCHAHALQIVWHRRLSRCRAALHRIPLTNPTISVPMTLPRPCPVHPPERAAGEQLAAPCQTCPGPHDSLAACHMTLTGRHMAFAAVQEHLCAQRASRPQRWRASTGAGASRPLWGCWWLPGACGLRDRQLALPHAATLQATPLTIIVGWACTGAGHMKGDGVAALLSLLAHWQRAARQVRLCNSRHHHAAACSAAHPSM